jgi:L-ascorbate metabolism protein UlaG (beta-lactamase superfamily)
MHVTWWGHSSVTVECAGTRLLFDPVLCDSIAHLRRRRGPTPPASARRADAVMISHLHADHCHLRSLRLLEAGIPVIGPSGIADFLDRALPGNRLCCQDLAVGERIAVGNVVLHALYAAHDHRRSPVSRSRAQPLSYLVDGDHLGAAPLWFGGDTALHDGMRQVAPVSVALVAVAGWGPALGPGHLDPEQAAQAVRWLAAEVAIPIHYGTFWPRGLAWLAQDQFLGPERRFEQHAKLIAPNTSVRILAPSETFDPSEL